MKDGSRKQVRYAEGVRNLFPGDMRFKGIRRSSSSASLPTRSCVYVWTYTCFIAAIIFLFIAGPGQVMQPISDAGSITARNFVRLPTRGLAESENCKGRRVYMYDLPAEYNLLLQNPTRCNHTLIPWMDLCPRFRNGGFGGDLHSSDLNVDEADSEFDDAEWYDSDFYMLEVTFHSRMEGYRCLTKDPSTADALYVPHYTGLLALDYLYKTSDGGRPIEERKFYGKDLVDWLEKNGGEAWRRYGGKDHFLVIGRTRWDFIMSNHWGTAFWELPHVANMTSLMIESLPGETGEQAIPYLTVFHPSSPRTLQDWIEKVKSSQRKYLFSYVGAPREDSSSVRGIMTSSCRAAGESVCNSVDCSVISCSHNPVPTYKSFLQSNFCLQPRGDTATRRSTFDCLIAGSIPVFFHKDTAYTQYTWHLPKDPKTYSVFIDEDDLRRGISIEHVLRSYSQETIDDMRKTIASMIPSLLYFDCRKDGCSSMNEMDAFDLTMQGLFPRIEAAKNQYLDS